MGGRDTCPGSGRTRLPGRPASRPLRAERRLAAARAASAFRRGLRRSGQPLLVGAEARGGGIAGVVAALVLFGAGPEVFEAALRYVLAAEVPLADVATGVALRSQPL